MQINSRIPAKRTSISKSPINVIGKTNTVVSTREPMAVMVWTTSSMSLVIRVITLPVPSSNTRGTGARRIASRQRRRKSMDARATLRPTT